MLLPKKIKPEDQWYAGGFGSGLAESASFPAGLVLCHSDSSCFGVSSEREAGGRGSSPCQWAGMGFHVPWEHTWSLPSRDLNIPKRQEQQSAENTRGEHPGQGSSSSILCACSRSQECAHRLDIRDLHKMSFILLFPQILDCFCKY